MGLADCLRSASESYLPVSGASPGLRLLVALPRRVRSLGVLGAPRLGPNVAVLAAVAQELAASAGRRLRGSNRAPQRPLGDSLREFATVAGGTGLGGIGKAAILPDGGRKPGAERGT